MTSKIVEILLVIVLLLGGYIFITKQSRQIDALTVKLDQVSTAAANFSQSAKEEKEARATYLNNLREFSDNENNNRRAVAAGTKQLSVKAICPQTPKAGDGPGISPAYPILAPDMGSDYFLARYTTKHNEELLSKCIADLTSATNELNQVGAYAGH